MLTDISRFDPEDVEFSATERTRIVRDVMHWKTELERGSGSEFDNEKFGEYLAMLQDFDDAKLMKHWYQTVGEWLTSYDYLSPPRGIEYEAYIDVQFGHLLAGNSTDYGFVVSVSLPPEITC